MWVTGQLQAPAALSRERTGYRVGPRADLDVLEKNLLPLPEFETPTVQPVK